MLIVLLILLVVAVFVLKELITVRRQVSSIRQSLEWYAVGFLEKRRDGLAPAVSYMENTKQDLIREGLSEGTLTEQQIQELFQHAEEEREDAGENGGVGSKGGEYRVQMRRGDHWMSVWPGFSHDQAIRICQWGRQPDREMRIVQEGP
jgi:hypothetical protein